MNTRRDASLSIHAVSIIFFHRTQCIERLTHSARICDNLRLTDKNAEEKGRAEGPLIYISDYFICINDSHASSIISIGNIIFHVSDNFVLHKPGALRPSVLLLATDVK